MMGISNTSSLTASYGLNYYEGMNLTYSEVFVTITYNGLNFELKYPTDIFNYNVFLGEIPEEIGQLKSLCGLNLAHNALASRIPSELASLHQLESLDLSSNQLSGPIPHELASLTSLDSLNLSYNALASRIPLELASLHQLESLDLSSNQLSGPIPHELTSLTSLFSLNLSYNNLVGEVPQGYMFSAFSNDSYLANPGLCGSPLSMQCAIPPSNIGFIVSIGVGLYFFQLTFSLMEISI